jgi:hypothetical protein
MSSERDKRGQSDAGGGARPVTPATAGIPGKRTLTEGLTGPARRQASAQDADEHAAEAPEAEHAAAGSEHDAPVQMSPDNSSKKTHSAHAQERAAQGRRTGPAFNDAQQARQADVFVQPDRRYVVRGPRGREHVFEPDGTHVTSIDRTAKAHQGKVAKGERAPISAGDFERFKEIFK